MTTDLQARLQDEADYLHRRHGKSRTVNILNMGISEIARLTAMVERLEIDREASGVALRDMHSKWETAAKNEAKADVLADAAKNYMREAGMTAQYPETVALKTALTDYQGDGK